MRFSQAYPGATAVLVDKFDAGGFQCAAHRQVVGSRHGGLTAGKFGTANSHVITRSEPPKDRLSKSLDPQNAVRFGWQA